MHIMVRRNGPAVPSSSSDPDRNIRDQRRGVAARLTPVERARVDANVDSGWPAADTGCSGSSPFRSCQPQPRAIPMRASSQTEPSGWSLRASTWKPPGFFEIDRWVPSSSQRAKTMPRGREVIFPELRH
jgi:hypothetical protein